MTLLALLSQSTPHSAAHVVASLPKPKAKVTVPINDHIDYDGGIVTWIDNINGDRP